MSMTRSKRLFRSCVECGQERPNYSGICDACKPLYPDVLPVRPVRTRFPDVGTLQSVGAARPGE